MEDKIEDYTYAQFNFEDFKVEDEGITKEYEFNKIDSADKKLKAKVLKEEREASEKTGFNISPVVYRQRGIHDQKQREEKKRVKQLVYHEVEQVREDAYQEGYKTGLERGREEVLEAEKERVEEVITGLVSLVDRFKEREQKLIEDQKIEVYALVRNLTKWIILRELKDDGQYVERLISKLVTDNDNSSVLNLKVGKNVYEQVKGSVEKVKEKFSIDKEVTVSVDLNLKDDEIDLDLDNSRIKSDISDQFKALDSLFEGLGVF